MNTAILVSEIFGLIVLLIILYGAFFETKQKDKKNLAFIILVVSVFVSMFFDALTYIPVNWVGKDTFHFVITLFDFIGPFFVFALFIQYLSVHFSAKTTISKFFYRAAEVFCFIGIVATFVYSVQGKLFVFVDGVYFPGEYYQGYLMTYMIVLGLSIISIFHSFRIIGFHDAFAAMMFLALPITAIIINAFNDDMAFSIAALAPSMLIVDKMLQGERETDLIESANASKELAHKDELTGLQNRLAYNTACSEFKGDETIGVLFADLNGLKYTNDHFGHKAGDELLCKFSKMLLAQYKKSNVYRISGDEFVVLCPKVSKDVFEANANSLIMATKKHEFVIASVGTAYGSQSELSRLIDRAESNMYVIKKEFHAKNPDFGRKFDA